MLGWTASTPTIRFRFRGPQALNRIRALSRTVILAQAAIRDLSGITQWQTQPGSGRAARERLRAIRRAIDALALHPSVHATGEHRGTREFSVEGHRVVYLVRPDTGRGATAGDVTVLRVFGPGQSRETL